LSIDFNALAIFVAYLIAIAVIAYFGAKRVLRPSISDRAVIWIGRAVVVVIGVGSWLIALGPQDLLAWLIWAAPSIMVNCFFWPIIGGLYWRRMNKHAAKWGMVAGFVATLASFAIGGKTIKVGMCRCTQYSPASWRAPSRRWP
jgi:Na+/proline symporter